jgi:hypothetical protein
MGSAAQFTLPASREVAKSELKEIWLRNVAATGTIEDTTIDGVPAKAGVNLFTELKLISLKKLLTAPAKKGDQIETSVKYTLLNSFPTSSEKMIHVVNYTTQKVKLVVELPEDRPAKSAKLFEMRRIEMSI